MIKKLHLYFYSLRSSAFFKPITLIMLFISVVIAFISCGWASKGIVEQMEYYVYERLQTVVDEQLDVEKVGKELYRLRDNGLFRFDADAEIRANFRGITIESNEFKEVVEGSFALTFFSDMNFNEQQISKGEQIAVVNKLFAEKFQVEVGDRFNFNGAEFQITNFYTDGDEDRLCIYAPYSVNLNLDSINKQQINREILKDNEIIESKIYLSNISIRNLDRRITPAEQKALLDLGIRASHYSMFTAAEIFSLIVLLILLIVNAMNVVLNVSYWLKANDRKYAVMKITGAKPSTIASAMIFESLLMVVLGSLVGIAAEHYMSAAFLNLRIEKFLWIHYAILVPSVLFAALVPIGIKVIKRIKSNALDRKIYS